MDLYDPQTLGIIVFGGFMVISAIGIMLVSSFSMKETSYEEALAKQRRELGKMQPLRTEKKKKEKVSEKKNRGKKKEDKPNGKLLESENVPEVLEAEPVIDPVPEPIPVPMLAADPSPVTEPCPGPTSTPIIVTQPALPTKDKKKKEKKVAKVEPASTQSAPTLVKSTPTSAPAPTPAKTTTAPVKPTIAPPKSAQPLSKSAVSQAKSAPAPMATAVLEAVTKEVPVMAVPPVGSQQAAAVVPTKAQEPKKKASKKKAELAAAGDSADAPLHLPYKAMVSTLSSMVFSEGEAQRLIEILSDKVGARKDTWQTATQKGDPMAVLKKQLEEKEKQLAAEQDDAAAAKSRLRELTRELSAEKAKVASVETRLSSQLSKREQEMIALQARMQASYQDHLAQSQRLTAKNLTLQEQLEKGPSAQMTRLQQENSILRDALNKATSQAESKQNADLAKLRQDCVKLSKELGEKAEAQQADEHTRRGLEAKVSASESQLALQQANHAEMEQALQRELEGVYDELRKAQKESKGLTELQVHVQSVEAELKDHSTQVEGLTVQLEQAQEEKSQLEQQLESINNLLEANQSKPLEEDHRKANSEELEQLTLSLQERDSQLALLTEELKQLKEMKQEAAAGAQINTTVGTEQTASSEEVSLIASLQDELTNLKEEYEQHNNAQQPDNSAELELLENRLTEKDALITSLKEQLTEAWQKPNASDNEDLIEQLRALQTKAKETLQTLFPHIPVETEQSNWLQDFTHKAQEALLIHQQSEESQSSTQLPDLLEKLKEAEESHSSLQAECEQYRTVLAETEGMLKDLQKSVEEEDHVWTSKMADSEKQLKEALDRVHTLEVSTETLKAESHSTEQLKEQMMLLEAQLEKKSETVSSDRQIHLEEMSQLKLLLSESQSQLEVGQKEAQAQREELLLIRKQLSETTECAQRAETAPGPHNGPVEAQLSQVQSQLSLSTVKLQEEMVVQQQLSEDFEQSQKMVMELQAQLDLLQTSGEAPLADTEDVSLLKERLEKEKKLSKDLGQAATKLQQLLKASQEQLAKEKETVSVLQGHLEGKGEQGELKEGTSV